MRAALSMGAQPDINDNHGRMSALHHAASNGHTAVVLALLHAGATIEIQDEIGITPLHTALYWGRLASCRQLGPRWIRPLAQLA